MRLWQRKVLQDLATSLRVRAIDPKTAAEKLALLADEFLARGDLDNSMKALEAAARAGRVLVGAASGTGADGATWAAMMAAIPESGSTETGGK